MIEESRRYLKHAVLHLIDAQKYVEHSAMAEPIGQDRNELTEFNIALLILLDKTQTAINRT